MSELGPNAFGETVDPGRVDCYLGLPLPADEDEEDGVGGVLVVALRWLLHPAVPQPAGSRVYELATGHPDRQSGELVFPADLTEELRAWPQERWAVLGVELDQVVAALVGCWEHGEVRGLQFRLEPAEDPRALLRPAMTLAREELRERLESLIARARRRWLHPTSGRRPGESFLWPGRLRHSVAALCSHRPCSAAAGRWPSTVTAPSCPEDSAPDTRSDAPDTSAGPRTPKRTRRPDTRPAGRTAAVTRQRTPDGHPPQDGQVLDQRSAAARAPPPIGEPDGYGDLGRPVIGSVQ